MRLDLPFTEAQLQCIYERALEVLATVGFSTDRVDVRDALLQAPGFSACGDRIVIERQAVNAALAERNQQYDLNVPCARPERAGTSRVQLSVGTHAGHVVECGADDVRPTTTQDVVDGIKLVRALSGERVVCSTVALPQDVPEPLRPAHVQMLSCIYSGRLSYTPATTDQQFEIELKFYEAMEQELLLRCHLPSPLRLTGDELGVVLNWWRHAGEICIGAMPQAGATAPASVPGLLIQSVAEMLGANCALRVLFPGKRINFNIGAHSTNFRTGGMVFGSPGALLVEVGRFQILGWLGCGWGGGRFMRTHAKLPGVQAAADKAAGAMLGTLLGAEWITSGGYISADEVWSPEQLVLDVDIRNHVAQATGDFSRDNDAFDISVIRECAEHTNFMSADDTAVRFRELAWQGRLFEYDMLSSWLQAGRPNERRRLTEIVNDLVRTDLPPAIDEHRQAAVRAVYEDAKVLFG